jgi:hypothetical protein
MSLRVWSISSALVAWALSVSCSSDDERQPPPASSTAGSKSQLPGEGGGSGAETGGAPQQSEGGAPVEVVGGEGGIGHLGLGGTVTAAGAPMYDDPLCDREASWSGDAPLANISTPDADERLLGMTFDALTVVFSRGDALLVADRASATADFGTPVAVTLPEPYTHTRGVALRSDGLAMIVVEAEGKLFADVTRSARSGTFDGEPDPARFLAVAENSELFSGKLSSPVLAADGSLYFTQIGPSSSRVFHSHLAEGDALFEVPAMSEDTVTLGGEDGKSKLTQSVSSDERTLFFFDEALGHTVGLWNSGPATPFVDPAEFPELLSVFSVAGCTHLYGTREVGGSLDVVLLAPN